MRLVSSPARFLQEIGRLDPGGPDDQFGGNASRHWPAAHRRAGLRPHARRCARLRSGSRAASSPHGQARWQRRQDPVGSLDHESTSCPFPDRCGRGRRTPGFALVWCSSAASSTPVAPAPMIATCSCSGRSGPACAWARMYALTSRRWKRSASCRRLERYRVFLRTRRTEIVGQAADGNDQRFVGEFPPRRDLVAVLVDKRRHRYRALLAVQANHFTDAVPEVVPMRLRQVVGFVNADIHAAGGDLMQMRFPDVHTFAVDQCDVDATPQLVAEPRRELESACAAADDDDAVTLLVAAGRGVHSSRRMGRVSFSGTSSACTSAALITPSAWAVSAIVAPFASASWPPASHSRNRCEG